MKSPSPLVSVVIPAYNSGCFLAETIQSILGQTYVPLEIIIVNDGSTDNTAIVLAKFRLHENLRVIHHSTNRGQAAARNNGIRAARGDYIAFCDADDIWLPEKVEKQMNVFWRNEKAEIVYCDIYKFDQHHIFPKTLWQEKNITPVRGGSELLTNIFYRNFIPGAMTVVKKDIFHKAGFYDESLRVCEEYDLWLRMIAANIQIDFCLEPLAKYRQHPNQISRNVAAMEKGAAYVLRRFVMRLGEKKISAWMRRWRFVRLYLGSAYRYGLRRQWIKMAQKIWLSTMSLIIG